MKWMFMFACVVGAMALSALAVVLAGGRQAAEAPEAMPAPGVGHALVSPAAVRNLRLSTLPGEKGIAEIEKSLKEQQALYEQKLAGLAEKEKEIESQKKIMDNMRAQVLALQTNLESNFINIERSEEVNIKKLGEIYAKMEPDGAAQLLMTLDKERAGRVLATISDRQAAAILGAAVTGKGEAGTKAATEWSEVMRRMRREVKPAT